MRPLTCARFIAAALACAVFAACNTAALPPGGTYQGVQGIVVDAKTNRPIAGASVTIDVVLHAVTDAQGRFEFKQVPVGELDYVVAAPQYTRVQNSTAHVAPDKPLVLRIPLSKGHRRAKDNVRRLPL